MLNENSFKIPPLYLEIGKQLAMDVANTFASTNPLIGLGVAAAKTIIERTAMLNKQVALLSKAQAENWTEDDPRWDAPLKEQQDRMDSEDRRHLDMSTKGGA